MLRIGLAGRSRQAGDNQEPVLLAVMALYIATPQLRLPHTQCGAQEMPQLLVDRRRVVDSSNSTV